MDEAPDSSPGRAPATTGLSPTVSAWDAYYKEASRRRRAAGGHRDLRVEKRRRRWRERLGMVAGILVIGAMTMVFYLVLR